MSTSKMSNRKSSISFANVGSSTTGPRPVASRSRSVSRGIGSGDVDKICTNGTDLYTRVLGPTADETILLGLQTLLGLAGTSSSDDELHAIGRQRVNIGKVRSASIATLQDDGHSMSDDVDEQQSTFSRSRYGSMSSNITGPSKRSRYDLVDDNIAGSIGSRNLSVDDNTTIGTAARSRYESVDDNVTTGIGSRYDSVGDNIITGSRHDTLPSYDFNLEDPSIYNSMEAQDDTIIGEPEVDENIALDNDEEGLQEGDEGGQSLIMNHLDEESRRTSLGNSDDTRRSNLSRLEDDGKPSSLRLTSSSRRLAGSRCGCSPCPAEQVRKESGALSDSPSRSLQRERRSILSRRSNSVGRDLPKGSNRSVKSRHVSGVSRTTSVSPDGRVSPDRASPCHCKCKCGTRSANNIMDIDARPDYHDIGVKTGRCCVCAAAQTIPPGYAFKCSKSVACPSECKKSVKSDSMVHTDFYKEAGGQTSNCCQCDFGSTQTGDSMSNSGSQTSRICLCHVASQVHRCTDIATAITTQKTCTRKISTIEVCLPAAEDESYTSEDYSKRSISRAPPFVGRKRGPAMSCVCGRSCPVLKEKKKVVRVCCDCTTSTSTSSGMRHVCNPRRSIECGQIGDMRSSSEVDIKYAITKITTFSSYTTFEVMRSTRKKPKKMPCSIMGVFVLKNFQG